MDFDESKHPRDKDGKFAFVGAKSLPDYKFKEFESPKALPTKPKSDKIKNITKQEWALYYKYIADEKYGGFIYHETSGRRWVRIETNASCKILIDNNEFQNAKVETVFTFGNSNDLDDTLNYFEKRGLISNDWQRNKT